MKRNKTIMILATALLIVGGCKKEMPEKATVPDLLKVDLSGEWNGYKYIDFSGLVPLEIIKIEKKAPGSNYYIATKVTGDNGVVKGEITWEGDVISNPFTVILTTGDGSGNYQKTPGMKMQITDPNTIKGLDFNVIFVRRTTAYFQ